MPTLLGQSLGRYHILEQLGEGGMATVYKAYDTRLERDVAIKIIRHGAFPPDHLVNMLKRFEREAKSLAKLSHPNIVKVLDFGEHEDAPYLVMEYFPGGTLKQRLGKPIPWQEAVRLLLPISTALEYAHEQNIIHRDIKPANILLTEKGQPMLSDFGIAKILESEETATLTGAGVGVGTPEYMSPEQWTGQATKQSDIYSLGVVLYEMVTGRKPYMADTPAAILLKQASEPLPRPMQFVADLPESVEKILIKALAKRVEDRYQAMGEFVHALETLPSGVSPVIKPQPSQPEHPRERKLDTQAAISQNEDATIEARPASGAHRISTRSTKQPPASSGIRRYWPLAVGGGLVVCIILVALIMGLGQGLNLSLPAIAFGPTITESPARTRIPASPITTTSIPGITQPVDILSPNYALQFDGNDDYVVIPNPGDFNSLNAFTVEAWINPAGLDYANQSGYKAIVSGVFQEPPFKGGGWAMFLDPSDTSNWGLSVCVPDCRSAESGSNGLTENEWQHIATVYDGQKISIYRNGILVAEAYQSGTVTDTNFLLLGIWETAFLGTMDEVRVWNIPRTLEEINRDMYKLLGGEEFGLMGYWTFEEGRGQIVGDKTSHHNDGRLGASDFQDNSDPVWIISSAPVQ